MTTRFYNNKVCWITGASSGIGESLALHLNKLGAYLILSCRNVQKLEKVKSCCAFPEKVVILPCDMDQKNTLEEIALESWKVFKGIDYVFLNAGIAVRDTIINTSIEMTEKVMNINFFSNVIISRTLLPFMIRQGAGCFIVTSSLSGKYGVPKLSAYAASKHALNGFFESLRAEHEKDGIKITIVTAGLVKTNISLNALSGNGSSYGRMQQSIENGITPDHCADEIIKAVVRGKNETLVGGLEKYSVWVNRLFPVFLAFVIRNHPLKKLRKFGLNKKRKGILRHMNEADGFRLINWIL